jgi:biopolymer transport protein ExbD
MTPMVDLGFLLIAFFVITAEMSKPVAANLYMPKDGDSTQIPQSKVLSVILSKNSKIFYYEGNWESAIIKNEVYETDFSPGNGIRNIIQKKQLELKDDNKDLMILFKADDHATYQNMIDMMDEIMINDVRKYALLKLSLSEKKFLKTAH